jgi:GTP-binding protein
VKHWNEVDGGGGILKLKGTKGRKPKKPHSKAGRRAKVAERARRAAPADRAHRSRAEVKREAARKPAEKPGPRGRELRPGALRRGPMRPIGVEEGAGWEAPPVPDSRHDDPATDPGTDPGTDRGTDPGTDRGPEAAAAIPPAPIAKKARAATLPLIAIVGRPNVGKSTLFNRLTGSRRSIVGDEPGITRDRIYGEVEWLGRRARVVDTGGIVPEDQELIPAEILRQAQTALGEAACVVMVVDGRSALTAPDYALAQLLFKGGKPLVLAVNKMDSGRLEQEGEFRRLGIRDLLPVSAEHAIGIDDLLDHVFSDLASAGVSPAKPLDHKDQKEQKEQKKRRKQDNQDNQDNREDQEDQEEPAEAEPASEPQSDGRHRTHGEYRQPEISIAIVGRPNVGKSTLLNTLTRSSRAIVSPVAGTTRDAVDEVVEYDGERLRFVDTAGIRRKGKTKAMAEKLSVVMARRHMEAADLALLIIDAAEGVTALDATIGGYAHESGRSVILVVNKWDLVTTGRTDGKPPADKAIFERQLRNVLKYLAYAPVVFISAAEGKNIHTILKLVQEVAAERRKRISTGQMNRFLERVDFDRATVPMSKKVRIFYMTQAAVAPPTFILFTDRQAKLHFSFERFLENQIRAAFGFRGSPIWFKVRARNQREAH